MILISKQFTLGKNERVKSRKLIEQLFKEGKNFSVFPFRVYYLAVQHAERRTPNRERQTPNAEHGTQNIKRTTANHQLPTADSSTIHHSPFTLQAGIGASSKNFKKAVDRNRIKRLTKEAYRLQKNILQDLLKEKNQRLALFFIYTGKELPEYKIVFEKMGLILLRFIKMMSESNPENT